MTPQELKIAVPTYRDDNIYLTDNDTEICIMYGNEEEYIKESVHLICERIHPETVVEFGFGFGYTAQQFQDEGVDLHIIYEPNDVIYRKALAWAQGRWGVFVVNSRFQDFPLPIKVDLVYNDIYEMCAENYGMESFDTIKNQYNFYWYAEFCVDYPGDEYIIGDNYFRFQIDEHDKIQMLVEKDGN